MTEAKWLAGNHLGAMAEYAWQIGSPRQWSLVGCGCCRLVWDRLVDERSREAVKAAERVADGAEEWLERPAYHAEAAVFLIGAKQAEHRKEQRAVEAGWLAEDDTVTDDGIRGQRGEQISFADAGVAAAAALSTVEAIGEFFNEPSHPLLTVEILRDIFGNPFRPVSFDPSWRSGTAVSLARVMYETRDFAAMPILADALQDAGCEHADILDHCRGNGPHVRGCWVIDLVLEKA